MVTPCHSHARSSKFLSVPLLFPSWKKLKMISRLQNSRFLSPFSLAVFSLAPAFRSNMVRRSRSQKIRLFCSLDDFQFVLRNLSTIKLTRWNANWCYSLETTYLIFEAFQILFATAWQLRSFFIKWYEKERRIKLRPLRLHNGRCFKTLNLFHVSSCEMNKFCNVLHETKQKKQTNSRECAVRTGNHL